MKFKAGAMYYALVVAVLMAIISSSTILYAYHSRVQSINLSLHQQAIKNTISAINLLTVLPDRVQLNTAQELTLFDDETQKVLAGRKYWGGFELIHATGAYNGFKFTKSAMVGANLTQGNEQALFLADLNRPLSLCGKVNITGAVALPQSGVKRAYIEGQSFIGNKLINGKITNSQKVLPAINSTMIEANRTYLNGGVQPGDSVVGIEAFEFDTIIQSFSEATLIIKGENISILRGVYQGNIRVVATQTIFIGDDVSLNDVVLYAPEIIIENNFEGSLQAFAIDSLVLEKKAKLTYPSLLAIINDGGSGKLQIQENAELQGVVFVYQGQASGKKENHLSIDKKVVVTGQVYVDGGIDLKGEIRGSLIAKKFVLKTPSSVYENHLLNATIDITQLPKLFAGIDLLSDNTSRTIAKWVE
jgi:cytoskeletal protein CcmA (bactofilin family)